MVYIGHGVAKSWSLYVSFKNSVVQEILSVLTLVSMGELQVC